MSRWCAVSSRPFRRAHNEGKSESTNRNVDPGSSRRDRDPLTVTYVSVWSRAASMTGLSGKWIGFSYSGQEQKLFYWEMRLHTPHQWA